MKKQIALILLIALVLGSLAGCMGTPVVYSNCTCPQEGTTPAPTQPAATEPAPADGTAVKTGLGFVVDASKSVSATGEAAGKAEYDVTVVAVNVDDEGKITACKIDGIQATVSFDTTGTITSDLTAEILTKNEKGDSYGMVAYGKAKSEWYVQADALAQYAVGKTAEELRSGAINESGYAVEGTDLATSATIKLSGYVAGIEKAVANAQHLGAKKGDELVLASLSEVKSSASATAEAAGNAQLDIYATALTRKDGKITSSQIDSLQAKVAFDQTGVITTDLTAPMLTKNELGDAYNMVAWGQAKAEWNVQAAEYAKYITGKTAAEVAGIAVAEDTKPQEGTDLATTVTIKIGEFQNLIAKAMQ